MDYLEKKKINESYHVQFYKLSHFFFASKIFTFARVKKKKTLGLKNFSYLFLKKISLTKKTSRSESNHVGNSNSILIVVPHYYY